MNKRCYLSLFLGCLIGFIAIGCQKEEDNFETPTSDNGKVNQWIDNAMREDYLWNDDLPGKSSLDFEASPETFFTSLLSSKDGKKLSDGSHHYFSTIEKTPTSKARAVSEENSYGFEYILYSIKDQNYYYARVLYVLPGSPAAESGLKRGDWIIEINGQKIHASSTSLQYGGSIRCTLGTLRLTEEGKSYAIAKSGEIIIGASRSIANHPILKDSVYHIGGKTIGYLCYNHFTSGPTGFDDHTYENELKDVIGKMKSQHVTEFIIDLRYNGGGNLATLQLLGSMLVPPQNLNDIFLIKENNKGEKTDVDFIREVPNLNLTNLYAITGRYTASASEALINGLFPYMDVTLIGSTTIGKNVGSTLHRNEKLGWDIWPITMKLYNSQMESDYKDGFKIEKYRYFADEMSLSINDNFKELGDTKEMLLSHTLNIIGVQSTSQSKVRNTGTPEDIQPFYSSLERKTEFGKLYK